MLYIYFCVFSSKASFWKSNENISSYVLNRFWKYMLDTCLSNQIKSNHFYCHITTAQVPWWVNSYERAPDSAEKQQTIYIWTDSAKKQQTIYIWTDSAKKTTNNLHMDRQCKKLHWSIYSAPDSAKKKKKQQQQFTYGQTVQKKTTTAIYIWTDSAKKTTAIYIWTVHIYRLYRRQCAKYTYMHSVRLVYYRDILNYQRHIIHRMGTSTLCTVSIHNVVYT